MSDAISLLKSNQVDGVIYTRLTLQHYLQENPQAPYQIVNFNIGTKYCSIALSLDSPLTRKLDEKLLSIDMQIKFQGMMENWLNLKRNN